MRVAVIGTGIAGNAARQHEAVLAQRQRAGPNEDRGQRAAALGEQLEAAPDVDIGRELELRDGCP